MEESGPSPAVVVEEQSFFFDAATFVKSRIIAVQSEVFTALRNLTRFPGHTGLTTSQNFTHILNTEELSDYVGNFIMAFRPRVALEDDVMASVKQALADNGFSTRTITIKANGAEYVAVSISKR